MLRHNLHCKMIEAADFSWMRINFEEHIHLAAVVGYQNLLSNQAGELIVGLVFLHDRQVGFQNRYQDKAIASYS